MTDNQGLVRVQFIGAFHDQKVVYLHLQDTEKIRIDLRLPGHKYLSSLSDVKLSAYGKPAVHQKPLIRQPDGTWTIEFPYDEPELELGLSNVAFGGLIVIPGTTEHRRKFNRIVSVVRPVNGRIRVVFDPAKLPRHDGPANTTVSGLSPRDARLHALCEELHDLQEKGRNESGAGSETPADPKTLQFILQQAVEEPDETLRRALFLKYLALA